MLNNQSITTTKSIQKTTDEKSLSPTESETHNTHSTPTSVTNDAKNVHDKRSPHLVLASRSSRRVELLQQLQLSFTQYPIDIDERLATNETIENYVIRMVREKAESAWTSYQKKRGECDYPVILTADTCGEMDGQLLNKPDDFQAARTMLKRLSGHRHTIYSAFALYDGSQWVVENVRSDVWFKTLTESEISAYWQTGEPCDKAGAYAIQGIGAQFVARLEGSYSAVMGLPLFELSRALARFQIVTL